jgi:hypothetical protein
MKRMTGTLGLAVAILLAAVTGLLAQPAATGNIYGKVTDESGAELPGVAVTLSGAFGTRTTTSGHQGDFRFLAVPHGSHQLQVGLTGFATVNRGVVVAIGQNVELTFGLKLAAMEETITVTAETPVVDTKKVGNRTTVTKDELAKIPTARDPWGLLQTVPGVVVDRVNLAGNESGQQANYMGKGSDPKNNVWAIDGVVITDMSTLGASPTYYTYDAFDQVSVSTGGNDVSMATGGVGIGFVTKRGTNAWRGNAVGYFTHDKLQSSNLPDELASDPRLQGSDKADHTEQISDYNFDLGGPIVKDRLWVWGSWGREDIRVKRLTQSRDKTELITKTAKLNWQASGQDMISAFWFLGSKIKIGRGGAAGAAALGGAGLQEADEFLTDQGDLFPGHPHGLSKIEWNRTFSPNFFLNAKWAYYSTGFTLGARQDRANDQVFDFRANTATGNANSQDFQRPQTTWQLDGSWFASGLGGNHEVKFGGAYRKAESITENIFSGNKTQARFNTTGSDRARFFRDSASEIEATYYTVYLSDTFTRDRLTMAAGVRWDLQQGRVAPSSVPGNPLVPNLLPGIDFAGGGQGIDWNDVSPRFGITYALDASRRTVARLSLARYAGQMQTGPVAFDSPVGGVSFLEYDWRDLNGDRRIQVPEVDFSVVRASAGLNPADPSALSTPDRIDPDYTADHDYEGVLGLDRELAGDLSVGVSYTWRRNVDTVTRGLDTGWAPRIGVTSADYVLAAPVTRNGYTVTPYVLAPGVAGRVTGGRLLTNRDDFHRQYHGIDLALTKRLSHRWMARLAASYMNWTDHITGPAGHFPNPNPIDIDPGIDGGSVIRQGVGSGKALFVGNDWQVAANALFEVGQGFELATNVFARQGYPRPIFIQVNTGAFEGTTNVLAVPAVDDVRLPNLFNMDLSLAKNLKLGGTSLTLRVECFNVLNSNTELNRVVNASSTAFNRLEEITAPRIVRFGARFGF